MSRREKARRAAARAFTLIELLVVILIIAVVISILIPAVGGARTAAKRSATQNLMQNLNSAVGQFENDERRLPGYFIERDMGSTDNATTYGMSAMENVMLDLIGMPPVGATTAPGITIGPTATTQLPFAFDLFGAPSSGGGKYFTPDPKFYVAQVVGTQQIIPSFPASGHARAEGDQNQFKDVVDAWGMPLLAWRADETATKPVANRDDFVAVNSSTTARFYWASNACFLRAPAAGKGYRQYLADTSPTSPDKGSMIGADSTAGTASTAVLDSLMAVLGSPSAPVTVTPPNAPLYPAAARGKFVLQSAGADGYFVGNRDRGRKQFAGSNLEYQLNFVTKTNGLLTTDRHIDKDNKGTTIDILSGFDDLVAGAGN